MTGTRVATVGHVASDPRGDRTSTPRRAAGARRRGRPRVGDQHVDPLARHGLAHRVVAELGVVGQHDHLPAGRHERLVGRGGEDVGRGQAAFDGDAVAGEEDLRAAQPLQALLGDRADAARRSSGAARRRPCTTSICGASNSALGDRDRVGHHGQWPTAGGAGPARCVVRPGPSRTALPGATSVGGVRGDRLALGRTGSASSARGAAAARPARRRRAAADVGHPAAGRVEQAVGDHRAQVAAHRRLRGAQRVGELAERRVPAQARPASRRRRRRSAISTVGHLPLARSSRRPAYSRTCQTLSRHAARSREQCEEAAVRVLRGSATGAGLVAAAAGTTGRTTARISDSEPDLAGSPTPGRAGCRCRWPPPARRAPAGRSRRRSAGTAAGWPRRRRRCAPRSTRRPRAPRPVPGSTGSVQARLSRTQRTTAARPAGDRLAGRPAEGRDPRRHVAGATEAGGRPGRSGVVGDRLRRAAAAISSA